MRDPAVTRELWIVVSPGILLGALWSSGPD